MLDGSCECGAIRIELEDAPDEVTDCNCGICRRTGARWSYFDASRVRILPPTGATTVRLRGKRVLEFHRCTVCGCLVYWCAVDRRHSRMGVNMRLFPPEVVAPLRAVSCDGASW